MSKKYFLIHMAAASLCAFAQDGGDGIIIPGDEGGNGGYNGGEEEPNHRRKLPGVNIIKFYHDSVLNEVRLSLPCNVAGVTISVSYGDGTSYYGYISSDNPVWNVTLTQGLANIVCTTDGGCVFKGEFYID